MTHPSTLRLLVLRCCCTALLLRNVLLLRNARVLVHYLTRRGGGGGGRRLALHPEYPRQLSDSCVLIPRPHSHICGHSLIHCLTHRLPMATSGRYIVAPNNIQLITRVPISKPTTPTPISEAQATPLIVSPMPHPSAVGSHLRTVCCRTQQHSTNNMHSYLQTNNTCSYIENNSTRSYIKINHYETNNLRSHH
jgi:hypothetical protein